MILLNDDFANSPPGLFNAGSEFGIIAVNQNGEKGTIRLRHSDAAPDIVTVEVINEQGDRICLPEYIELRRTIPPKYTVPNSGQEA